MCNSESVETENELEQLSHIFEYEFNLNNLDTEKNKHGEDYQIVHEIDEKPDSYVAIKEATTKVKEFIDSILKLNLNHNATNSVLESTEVLLKTVNDLNHRSLEADDKTKTCLNSVTDFVCNELSSYGSQTQ